MSTVEDLQRRVEALERALDEANKASKEANKAPGEGGKGGINQMPEEVFSPNQFRII